MENRIKEIRILNKITQEELSRMTNISLSTIRNIEKNRNIPNIELAIKIKRALKVQDIEELFII